MIPSLKAKMYQTVLGAAAANGNYQNNMGSNNTSINNLLAPQTSSKSQNQQLLTGVTGITTYDEK